MRRRSTLAAPRRAPPAAATRARACPRARRRPSARRRWAPGAPAAVVTCPAQQREPQRPLLHPPSAPRPRCGSDQAPKLSRSSSRRRRGEDNRRAEAGLLERSVGGGAARGMDRGRRAARTPDRTSARRRRGRAATDEQRQKQQVPAEGRVVSSGGRSGGKWRRVESPWRKGQARSNRGERRQSAPAAEEEERREDPRGTADRSLKHTSPGGTSVARTCSATAEAQLGSRRPGGAQRCPVPGCAWDGPTNTFPVAVAAALVAAAEEPPGLARPACPGLPVSLSFWEARIYNTN